MSSLSYSRAPSSPQAYQPPPLASYPQQPLSDQTSPPAPSPLPPQSVNLQVSPGRSWKVKIPIIIAGVIIAVIAVVGVVLMNKHRSAAIGTTDYAYYRTGEIMAYVGMSILTVGLVIITAFLI